MKLSEKRLLGKRLLSKKKRRLNYDEYKIDTLPVEFLSWVDDVIKDGYSFLNFWPSEIRESKARIIFEIVFVSIIDTLPFTKLKDTKVTLINLAKINEGKLLPKELTEFGEKYSALKELKSLEDYIHEETITGIERTLDKDLISKAESTGKFAELEERLVKMFKGIRKRRVKTKGHPRDPLLNGILYRCYCAFDGKLDQRKNIRIAEFVDVICSYDFIAKKDIKSLVRRRLDYIIEPGENETIDQRISFLDNQWRSVSKLTNEDLDFLKELITRPR